MKKLLTLLGLIAMASVLFMGCPSPSDGGTDDGKSDTPTVDTPDTPDTPEGIAIVDSVTGDGVVYEDGKLTITAGGDWGTQANVEIKLKSETDFSNGIKITGYVEEGWFVSDNGLKIIPVQDDTHQSEQNFQLTTTASSVDVTEFRVCWTSDNSLSEAEMSKIVSLKILTQLDKGVLVITNIEAL